MKTKTIGRQDGLWFECVQRFLQWGGPLKARRRGGRGHVSSKSGAEERTEGTGVEKQAAPNCAT